MSKSYGNSRRLRMLLKGLTLLAIAPALALCSPMTRTVVINTYCDVSSPITYSSRDTQETINQVTEHNAVYDELCPKGG